VVREEVHMKISEVMHTPVVTCPSWATLGQVARVMRDKHVGCVLLTDRIGYLAGIVTDRDLAIRGLAAGRSADARIEDVMTRDVVTVSIYSDLTDAASIMSKRQVRRLPAVDEHDHPHGMITLDDLVRQLGTEADALADTIITQASGLARH
jgi:signal-transduction protein with cAMP-binding, CBS, and nucleotidyltransferase domain